MSNGERVWAIPTEPDPERFEAALAEYLERLRQVQQEQLDRTWPNAPEPVKLVTSRGRRYVRVLRDDNGGCSVVCFVDMATPTYGCIWKANTYRSPALNFPRGNIFKLEGHRFPPYGY